MLAPLFVFSIVGTAAAQERPDHRKPETVRMADLSAYDCASVSTAAAPTSRHMGQVIKGQYYEWNVFFSTVEGQRQLICISIEKPTAHQLSRDEAADFLKASAAVGRPNPNQQTNATSPEEPKDVQAEPLKRPLRGQSPNSSAEQQKNKTPELPPMPASQSPVGSSSSHAQPASPQAAIASESASTAASPDDLEHAQTNGVDDRTQVSSTFAYPWNTVGYLSVTYSDGESFRCSGTVVSPYVVLTAGHCLHNKKLGGFVTSARFYPGQYQVTLGDHIPVRPYGGNSDVANLNVTQAWTQISGELDYPITDYKNDFASVQFKTAFTFTDTYMPVIYSSTDGPITNAGYPATAFGTDAYGMYTETGVELNSSLRSYHIREFKVDATGGNSGGPFFYVDPVTNQRAVVGSLSYSDDLDDDSGGPWYDSWNQSLLSSWVAWTPQGAAAGSVSGLRFPMVFSSVDQDTRSYLRIYNGDSAAGTVDVTLADYMTGTALATWTSPSIPAGSSQQFYIQTIEDGANKPFTKPLIYSVSVRPTFSGYMTHIVWQVAAQSLTNFGTCDAGVSTDPRLLINIHSGILQATYPGSFTIHNTGASSANIQIGIYNANTGARMGTYNAGTVPANGQKVVTVATMESESHVSPPNGVFHYVLKSDTAFTGYMQQFSRNAVNGAYNDMTATCRLTP